MDERVRESMPSDSLCCKPDGSRFSRAIAPSEAPSTNACDALSGRLCLVNWDPRALPWADMLWPFRPEYNRHCAFRTRTKINAASPRRGSEYQLRPSESANADARRPRTAWTGQRQMLPVAVEFPRAGRCNRIQPPCSMWSSFCTERVAWLVAVINADK